MIEGSYQGFDVAVGDDGVAVITLNRPERLNAMSFGTRRDLAEVLSLAQLDDDVRVLVITGTGRGFCAGMYLGGRDAAPEPPTLVPDRPPARYVPANLTAQLHHFSQGLIRAVRRLDKLTIAAVNGYAIQIGLSLALACDYAVVARSAVLGSATLRMAYQPDEGGHWLLVEHLGTKRALDFVMRQRMVKGDEAVALGLATEAVDDAELLDRALALARELAAGPQVAMRYLKRAVYNAAHLTFEQAGDDIAVRTAVTDFHADAREGAPAWLRKEEVVFNRWLDEPPEATRH
jgi:2-(1,2-epoxy-1,2-dihydrophenyl)acetyl-CoA isomerase